MIAPVPCASTFSATVPISGLRAMMQGSRLGFTPAPRQFSASSDIAGSVAESVRMLCNNDTEALKWLSAVEAFALNPPGRLHALMMLAGVICDSENFKVLKSVVVLDFVSVVDMLPSLQLSANMRLHDDTMLKLVFVADSNSDVPIRSHKAARVLVTSSALH